MSTIDLLALNTVLNFINSKSWDFEKVVTSIATDDSQGVFQISLLTNHGEVILEVFYPGYIQAAKISQEEMVWTDKSTGLSLFPVEGSSEAISFLRGEESSKICSETEQCSLESYAHFLGKNFRELLSDWMLQNGIGQHDLSRLISVKQSQISYILSGKQYPSIKTLTHFSSVMGLPVELLAYADTTGRLQDYRVNHS